ncbi:MAG: hypothetical protein RL660_576 [Bacteroidota bacterium]|jgi:hypothetical protein
MKSNLPIKHISARVPWHDNKWNGNTCCNVLDNSFCRILARIDATKDPNSELSDKVISENNFPPCIAEKGTFLSPNEYTRELKHNWSDFNKLFQGFKPSIYHHKPYSFNAVPFLWMMKEKANSNYPHYSAKADTYELDYDTNLEEKVDEQLGFDGNTWVQHHHNQKVLLDAFFGCLKKNKSLVFFYCKETPLSLPNERVIVGVAKVKTNPSSILEYEYEKDYKGHRSYPWDRCIEHTLTPTDKDGFLLPYHDIIEFTNTNEIEIEGSEYVAYAPDFNQFSYASELVEHDTAIDALLNIAESLKKAELLLGKSYRNELNWIDNEISAIWDMRGAFPGLGPVLSALDIEDGNTIAWEIEKYIYAKDGDLLKTNPWNIFEESVINPTKYIKERGEKLFNPTMQRIWKSKPSKKKEYIKLVSRCQLNNSQATLIVSKHEKQIGSVADICNNLYLLYEKTRFLGDGISFRQIDKAILPPEKIRLAFPLSNESSLTDNLDEKRVRAFSVSILEEASAEGHSLLPFNEMLERMRAKVLDEPLPIDEDILTAQSEEDFFIEEIGNIQKSKSNKTLFFKLQRLSAIKTIIRQRINIQQIIDKPYGIKKNWLELINEHFENSILDETSKDYNEEMLARAEKAEALNVLTNYKFSVLIGPAGSGKTSLLEIFEKQPEIMNGGLLKLAPTGKARVKLGADAKTLAQFLYPDRYDAWTGTYFINEDAPKIGNAKNIIIDEASMLTEEQLAALFDALGPVDRIILVGDYRQLPPIGTGRPFVDIVSQIKPSSFPHKDIFSAYAYAELKKIRRQNSEGDYRWDVALSRCFSDEPTKEDLEAFYSIASGQTQSEHIKLIKWYESKDFRESFEEAIINELHLDKSDIVKSFNRTIGAKDIGNYQYFNFDYAEKVIEDWQVISPVNGYGYGVKEVNKFFQTTFRKPFIEMALNVQKTGTNYFTKRKVAKPKGNDNIVYGDKVINLKNTRWENWQKIKPYTKKEEAFNYIANGEIGIMTGEFRGKESTYKGEPNVEVAFSTQAGYSYVFNSKDLGEEGKYSLDLAYAITVHKSQGSGFKKVFFVMPSKGAILSRELLYTALTRQEHKIIILHQGDFQDFVRLASTDASATAKRFTDLFLLPDVKQLNQKWYDARYINISERGEPMISKNEVIIANCLHKYKKQITYSYEDKLKFDNSQRTIKPDFTIDNIISNKRFYWEHLGMMTQTEYREKWQLKLKEYINEGFVLHTNCTSNDEKILIITEENPNGGINSQVIDEIVRSYILEYNE